MTQAKSISLNQFTSTVQSAVKSAVKKHPKFQGVEAPQGITFNYLIRGIPVPEALLQNVTFAETQAFANEVAAHVSAGGTGVEAFGGGKGALYSVGGHIIIGIPATEQFLMRE